jgi:hypothetical protein
MGEKIGVKFLGPKLDSSQYRELIAGIRQAAAGRPLWKIEEYWIGYR